MPVMTLDRFLEQEETEPYSEYACGTVLQKPMPTRDHSTLQMFLGDLLFQYLSHTPMGSVFPEFRCIFGPPGRERAYIPDLCYVAQERLTADQYLHQAPDLAIEILSPDQHRAHFLDKIQFYLLYGVRLVWVIDPATRTITVQSPGNEGRILSTGATLDGGEVLPGFQVAVDDIFAQMPL